MSTLATADLPSDEEGDADFIPADRPKKRRKLSRATSDSSSSDSDEAETPKKRKAEDEAIDTEERQRKAADAFAAFKNEPVAAVAAQTEEMVVVKRTRKFAGETVV
jgi:hypothetical protein